MSRARAPRAAALLAAVLLAGCASPDGSGGEAAAAPDVPPEDPLLVALRERIHVTDWETRFVNGTIAPGAGDVRAGPSDAAAELAFGRAPNATIVEVVVPPVEMGPLGRAHQSVTVRLHADGALVHEMEMLGRHLAYYTDAHAGPWRIELAPVGPANLEQPWCAAVTQVHHEYREVDFTRNETTFRALGDAC